MKMMECTIFGDINNKLSNSRVFRHKFSNLFIVTSLNGIAVPGVPKTNVVI